MKKKLHEIFDEATPMEIDQFTSELEASRPDKKVLSSVKNKVYAKVQDNHCNNGKGRIITMKKEKKFTRIRNSILTSAACLAMIFGCFAGYNAITDRPAPVPTQTVVGNNTVDSSSIVATTVMLDVNPSIVIKADETERVLEVIALNKDAERIMSGIQAEEQELEQTVNDVIGSMIENGYINAVTNSVLLSVDGKDEDAGNIIKDKLSKEISDMISTEDINGSVISQTVSSEDEELCELASQYGISIGKAKLIQTIVKMKSGREFSDYAGLNITQLNTVMNSSVQEPSTDNIYIGEEKALEIALNQMSLTLDDLSLEPVIELVASRGEVCYQIVLHREWKDESGENKSSFVVYVNAFTGKNPGAGVTSPNFSIEEAWSCVLEQLGEDGEKAVLKEQIFNDMKTSIPMTYSFYFEMNKAEYCALVDAMSGFVIRINNF